MHCGAYEVKIVNSVLSLLSACVGRSLRQLRRRLHLADEGAQPQSRFSGYFPTETGIRYVIQALMLQARVPPASA